LTCFFDGIAIQPNAGHIFLVVDLKIRYLNVGQAGQIQTQSVTVIDKDGTTLAAEGSGIPDCPLGRGTHFFCEDEQSVSFSARVGLEV
jgi:hypothetical protein